MSFSPEFLATAERVIEACRTRGLTVGTAESCTGGLVMSALTEIPGASDVVAAGYVTYADDAKVELLGLDAQVLEEHGAVSAEVAQWMAHGALDAAGLDLAVAMTGIAGPAGKSIILDHKEERFGDLGQHEVRMCAVLVALQMLEAAAGQ